ncbi:MAG: Hsp70 family protein, partial [Bacillota bacterium]|nr:Hsp70 family protein [Bacillota bacterium]
AAGAAIQAAVLAGEVKDIVLLDVTPLTLGIETLGNVMTPLIQRNTTIPTRKSEIFSTAADGQTQVEIHVLQGERPMAADNRTLGRFQLMGIPHAPRGVPQIEVAFDIDQNGILDVNAKDLGTGKEQKIRLTASTQMTRDEVDRLVKDAEKHADADKERKESAEAQNKADQMVYSIEKNLKEIGDRLDGNEKAKVERALSNLKDALKGSDTAEIKRLTDELQNASYKLFEELYKKQAGGQAPPEGAAASQKDEDVVDADFRPTDEKDKEKR